MKKCPSKKYNRLDFLKDFILIHSFLILYIDYNEILYLINKYHTKY